MRERNERERNNHCDNCHSLTIIFGILEAFQFVIILLAFVAWQPQAALPNLEHKRNLFWIEEKRKRSEGGEIGRSRWDFEGILEENRRICQIMAGEGIQKRNTDMKADNRENRDEKVWKQTNQNKLQTHRNSNSLSQI